MDESNQRWLDSIIDAELGYRRGEGPQPSLEGSSAAQRAEASALIEIIDALDGSLLESPVFEEDPVARRLRLAL